MKHLNITDQNLLDLALTHRSYLNENPNAHQHNERLEYLGDAVLELAVSEYLYKRFKDKPEGDLTAYRASLVKTTTLAKVAQKLGLGEKLKMSKGEESSGGRTNQSLLANTFEAVVGALYLDKDYNAVVDFLEKNLYPELNQIIKLGLYKDFKSTLQELVQSQGSDSPEYEVINESGPDHDKEFTVVVLIDGKKVATGKGKSKQKAQQRAAQSALEILQGE